MNLGGPEFQGPITVNFNTLRHCRIRNFHVDSCFEMKCGVFSKVLFFFGFCGEDQICDSLDHCPSKQNSFILQSKG